MRLRLALAGVVAGAAALAAAPAPALHAAPAGVTVLSVGDPRGDVQGPRAALRKQRLVAAADMTYVSSVVYKVVALIKFKQHKDNPVGTSCCAPPRELRHTLVMEFPDATLLGEVSQRNVRGKRVRHFSLSTVTSDGDHRVLKGVRGGVRQGGRVVWMKVPLDQLPGDVASRGVVTTALTLAGGKRTLRDAVSFAEVDFRR
ncbi:MAG: hypothetical protein CMH83_02610 [Nocardioides sp.]|nr:hypothetical protein [Nocardioides sp.]